MIPYQHEPFTDFTKEENREAYFRALEKLKVNSGKIIHSLLVESAYSLKIKHVFTILQIAKKQSGMFQKQRKNMHNKR